MYINRHVREDHIRTTVSLSIFRYCAGQEVYVTNVYDTFRCVCMCICRARERERERERMRRKTIVTDRDTQTRRDTGSDIGTERQT